MKPKRWLALGALASMPLTLAAQQTPTRLDPLVANAPVPAALYKSAFDNYQAAKSEQQPSADKVWRLANEQVAKPHAHAGNAVQAAESSPPPKASVVDHSNHH